MQVRSRTEPNRFARELFDGLPARYDLLAELFEGVVLSGDVGLRKPAPRIYELGAEAIALPPARCVFVDDLPFNLPPAQELGMATIHHSPPRRRTTTPPAENSRALFAVDLPATELRRGAGLPAAACRCPISGALIQERCIRRAGKLHRKG